LLAVERAEEEMESEERPIVVTERLPTLHAKDIGEPIRQRPGNADI
jgi:hypothetical protein